MTETASFGYWILRQRKALDLTRAELASQVNCATETIKKIERDERRPSRQIAELLAKALAVPPDERERFLKIARGELPVDRLYLATRPLHPLAASLHNFPASLTPFVGRKKEIEAITGLILDKACRLLNIVGPGGIGKTRLTVATASKLAHDNPVLFRDGLFFIPLAPLRDSVSLISAVASSLRFVPQAHENELKDQLINYLRTKQILLILDNFEHLIDETGLELLVDLLSAAAGLKIIITSRARLNVQGEQIFLLEGLETPDIQVVSAWQNQVEQANEYSSLQLFALCARRARSNFKLTAENLVHITRICQMVQGMPLAIELSAAWIPALAPEKIATEVEKSLDILNVDSHELPERQRSIRSVFATSWRLLSAEEQEAIQRLSVYRGGFTRETAETSQQVSISTILSLVNKCWVQPEEKSRFQMHELLRQYTCERLQLDANLQLNAHHLHSAYFCHFLKERESGWLNARQLDIVNEIDAESQNVAAAWEWAMDHENIDLLQQAIDSLCDFYEWTGRQREGEMACLKAIRKMVEITAREGMDTADALEVQVKAMVWQGFLSDDVGFAARRYQEALALLAQLGGMGRDIRSVKAKILISDGVNVMWSDPNRAWQLIRQSLLLYKALGDEANEGQALSFLGTIAWVNGEFDQATQLTQKGLAIRKRLGNRVGMANSLDILGKILRARGQLSEAEKCNRESLALLQELGRPSHVAVLLTNLAHTLIWEGKFVEAEAHARESLAGFDDLNITSPYTSTLISKALLHQGQYAEALAYAQSSLELGQKKSDPLSIGLAHYNLGDIALVENRLLEAQEQLHKSSASMLANKQNILYGLPMADLVYASLALNQPDRAAQYLCQCLECAIKTRSFMPAIQALPAIALLASDQGNIEWAVEVYALARTYPFIVNSQWFEDMAGKPLSVAAAQLPNEVVEAASSRGKALDLWQLIEEWQAK
jgi:predicted ATPase/tetratricopeptide (TPR) repeat protein/DNA-binding XRE family transcriptional regulator